MNGGAGGEWADMVRRGARLADAMSRASAGKLEIATTPKDEIWRDGKVSVSRYRPVDGAPKLGPMLILHGLFGRQTITDLEPRRSLVRKLLTAGTDLYVLDWGNPSRADMCLDFTDYAEYWLGDALAAIRAESGAEKCALFAICQGGVFALCHAARHPEAVSGLALAVTPVDFHADLHDPNPGHGFLNVWARNLAPPLIAEMIEEYGNLPGDLTGAVFQQLTPLKTASKYTTELATLADDPEALETFLRMELWLSDRPDHPGAAARNWLIDLYSENRLVAGTFETDGLPVDLSAITCPILNIVAEEDHIVPPPCCHALAGLTASTDYWVLDVPTGHIGVFVSEKAREVVAPAVVDWLATL